MEIENIEFHYYRKAFSDEFTKDGLRHIKALPWLSIVQSIEGSYQISINNSTPNYTGDGGFFIAPSQATQDITHHLNKKTERMVNRWLFLDVYINKNYPLDYLYDFPIILPDNQKEKMNILFDQIFASDNKYDEMSLLYQVLKVLMEAATLKDSKNADCMINVINFMHKHYAENITISQLATIAKMSDSHFYPIFKKTFGETPISYLNQYRLSLASDKLRVTNLPINKIAESVGIMDSFYFSKIFHNKYHCSPKEYRKH